MTRYIICICMLFGQQLWGQSDSSRYTTLLPVEVTASRAEAYTDGQKVSRFDSTTLEQFSNGTLSDLLQQSNSLFLRSYAPGGLSTASSRGTGYRHTAVVWNGFNLQSAMNGGVDLNLMPVFLMEGIQMQHGGGSALYGSGAVGGNIQLINRADWRKGHHGTLRLTAGSYEEFGQYGRYHFASESYAGSIKLFHRAAVNDFRFADNGRERRQQNAGFRQYGILQNNHFKLPNNQMLHAYIWYQDNDRDIPPNRAARNNEEEQRDQSFRAAIEWQKYFSRASLKSRAAYLDETLNYNSTIVRNSNSRTRSVDWQTEWNQPLDNSWQLNGGFQYIHRQARAISAFPEDPMRDQYALFASLKKSHDKWSASFNLRQEWVDGQRVPFTASVGGQFQIVPQWILTGRVHRTYNLPTFNDLYWAGAGGTGNPDLRAENGWGGELGFRQKIEGSISFSQQIDFYSQWIDNWIQWLPSSGLNWEPENLRSVWARGFEYSWKLQRAIQEFLVQVSASYNLSLSTIDQLGPTDAPELLGKQLIQTPRHNASAQFGVRFRRLHVSYNHQYTARRFTTSDNKETQPAFHIAGLRGSYALSLNNKPLSVSCQIQNLWNNSYEVVPLRPMPLRYFQFSLAYTF